MALQMALRFRVCLCLLFLLQHAVTLASVIHLNLTGNLGRALSSRLHGLAFEEIYHSGDGGVYAQKLEDPGLLADASPTYSVVNDRAAIEKDTNTPLTSAIVSTLKVSVNSGTAGQTGIINDAYGGFRPEQYTRYNCTFYIKGRFNGALVIGIFSTTTRSKFVSKLVSVRSTADKWTKVFTQFISNKQPEAVPYKWSLTFEASLIAGRSINIGYPTLIGGSAENQAASLDCFPGFCVFLEAGIF